MLPSAVIDCQVPVPGRTTLPLSVCRKPMNNGAALVSCFTTAFKYWSSVVFRHARSHVCADAMAVANAAIKRTWAEIIRKRAERIGGTSGRAFCPNPYSVCELIARFSCCNAAQLGGVAHDMLGRLERRHRLEFNSRKPRGDLTDLTMSAISPKQIESE